MRNINGYAVLKGAAIGFTIAALFLSTLKSHGASLDTREVIHAVAMEASGEPYQAQLCICAVIRTRGSLKGIYGAKATRKESAKVYASVTKAWNESATNDPTHGCTMFGGIIDDKYFIGKLHLTPVLTIGKTRFYKQGR